MLTSNIRIGKKCNLTGSDWFLVLDWLSMQETANLGTAGTKPYWWEIGSRRMARLVGTYTIAVVTQITTLCNHGEQKNISKTHQSSRWRGYNRRGPHSDWGYSGPRKLDRWSGLKCWHLLSWITTWQHNGFKINREWPCFWWGNRNDMSGKQNITQSHSNVKTVSLA